MNIVIIEDEILASEMLKEMLLDLDHSIQINAILQSASEVTQYFKTKQERTDLVFMDIQLRNENTLNLLEEIKMPTPFVLMTGYDRSMMNAFEKKSIDFMLKPISQERVSIALKKYRDLQNYFSPKIEDILWSLQQNSRKYRQRLLLKKGREFFFINVEDIAYVYTDRSIVIIADFNNQKFISEYKILNTLELELDLEHSSVLTENTLSTLE